MDSILKQTLADIEIICVDDELKDNSLEILREYEKKDSRIRVIAQENQEDGGCRKIMECLMQKANIFIS